MAYTDFTLKDIQIKFGINNIVERLFPNFEPINSSDWLTLTLLKASKIRARSEKAKSETIVFPILLELKERNDELITIYSGDNLTADENIGLKGECDFIITKDSKSFDINFPIIQIVEAKKHDIDSGIPQCAAQMLGAKIYNENNNANIEYIYGCVTTGDDWLFMKLGKYLQIDNKKYYLGELGELLSVFQHIIDEYKKQIF
jgi:hypothetical protein